MEARVFDYDRVVTEWVDRVIDHVMLGTDSELDPDSLMFELVQRTRKRLVVPLASLHDGGIDGL